MAKGINPKMVVIAVNKTGRKRALPAFTILSKSFFSLNNRFHLISILLSFCQLIIVHNLTEQLRCLPQFQLKK